MLLRYGVGLTLMIVLYLAANRLLIRPLGKRYSLGREMKKLLSHSWLYGPCLLLLWLLIRPVPKVPVAPLDWGFTAYLGVFAAQLFMMPLAIVFTFVESKLWGERLEDHAKDEAGEPSPTDGIYLLLLAPFFEELFTRKFLYDRLAGYNLMLFLFAAACFFGLMHAMTGRLAVVMSTIHTGFVLALIYAASGSLWLAVLFHALSNFLLVLLPQRLEQQGLNKAIPPYRALVFVAGCGGLVWLILRFNTLLPAAVTARTGEAFAEFIGNAGVWIFALAMAIIYVKKHRQMRDAQRTATTE